MTTADIRTGYNALAQAAKKHQLLVLTVVALLAAAGSAQFLRGDIVGGPDTGSNSSSGRAETLRDCSSEGTLFEDVHTLHEVRATYREQMSAVFGEREAAFKTPSQWDCSAEAEEQTQALQSLASQMPGFRYFISEPRLFGGFTVTRPVTFDSFSAVVAEFQREYECKLTEMQDRILAEVAYNQDVAEGASFCCTTLGCKEALNPALCLGELTQDPMCDNQCSSGLTFTDLATRLQPFHQDLFIERQTSRTAVERALQTLHSMQIHYAVARQLICYERASLDLRNEMSLLADAISCMPKIWDATTSLHDPASSSSSSDPSS